MFNPMSLLMHIKMVSGGFFFFTQQLIVLQCREIVLLAFFRNGGWCHRQYIQAFIFLVYEEQKFNQKSSTFLTVVHSAQRGTFRYQAEGLPTCFGADFKALEFLVERCGGGATPSNHPVVWRKPVQCSYFSCERWSGLINHFNCDRAAV